MIIHKDDFFIEWKPYRTHVRHVPSGCLYAMLLVLTIIVETEKIPRLCYMIIQPEYERKNGLSQETLDVPVSVLLSDEKNDRTIRYDIYCGNTYPDE